MAEDGDLNKVNDTLRTLPRVLVLGSEPHARSVTAYSWEDFPPQLNVADYDVVILNLTPFSAKEPGPRGNLHTLLSWQQFARLLFSEGSEVIAIGVPTTRLGSGTNTTVSWWLPYVPDTVLDSGEEIREVEPAFGFYFSYVRRWSFHVTSELRPQIGDPAYAQVVHPDAVSVVSSRMLPLAETRFQNAIGFNLRFQALNRRGTPLKESGNVIWLPPPTEASVHDAVDLILRERYDVGSERAAPRWIEDFKLPSQLPIEAEITKHEECIQQLRRELSEALRRLESASRFRKLLYEQGEDALEPVVRDAFRELGGLVEDPQQRGREDGRLVDPTGRKGMIEIKGRTGSLRLADVRQLDQWVRDAIANENWDSKGILVANMYCNDPPGHRDGAFPDNCVGTAQRFGLCLMTTTQLFAALSSFQRNDLDLHMFWDALFNTNGVCSLPELTTPEEASAGR